MDLTFYNLTTGNFGDFKESILRSELLYLETIRSTEEDYQEVLETDGAICVVGLIGQEFVGSTVAYPPTKVEEAEYKINSLVGRKHIYLFNMCVEAAHQGKGYGACLLGELIRRAISKGHARLFGHFREGRALALAKKFGAVELNICEDWEDTGETYRFCEINLSQVPL